ncbi:MAG: hypothetical protein C4337_05030 [Armatimonadota bacterium]
MRKVLTLTLCVMVVSLWADISFGGSPSTGMGGAGLAVVRNPGSQMYQNPALTAYVKGVRFGLGSFMLNTKGASLSNLIDDLKFRQGSIVDIDKAADLLRKYAREDTRLVATGDLGLVINGFAISAGAIVDARLLPNDTLQNWASKGASEDIPPTKARGDIIAMGVASVPDVAGAMRFNFQGGELAVGARVRSLRVFYTHYFAERSDERSPWKAERADELKLRDYLEFSTTSADLGFLWRTPEGRTSYALVIENFVEPNLSLEAADRNGDGIVIKVIKPFKRAMHLGIATEVLGGGVWAFDIIDIGNNTGRSEIRTGYEQRLGAIFLRSGYASRTGWTAGIGIGGFNLAYSKEFPIQVSRMLNF